MEMIRQDMRFLIAGCAALDVILLIGAACLGQFSFSLLGSILFSSLFSILNLILLIFHLKSSLLKSPHGARRRAMGNYLLRLSILGVVVYLGLTRDYFNVVGVIIPLLFPKLILSIRVMTQKGGTPNGNYN